MSDDGIEKWFLIDTEKEFCIVKEEAVVYDDSVDVGDKVNFFWTKRMELSGTVLAIGSEMECRDKACQIRKESKKKADSFDEKKPRKTAIAFTNSLKSLTNSKSSKSTAASQNNKSSKKSRDSSTSKKEQKKLVKDMERKSNEELLAKQNKEKEEERLKQEQLEKERQAEELEREQEKLKRAEELIQLKKAREAKARSSKDSDNISHDSDEETGNPSSDDDEEFVTNRYRISKDQIYSDDEESGNGSGDHTHLLTDDTSADPDGKSDNNVDDIMGPSSPNGVKAPSDPKRRAAEAGLSDPADAPTKMMKPVQPVASTSGPSKRNKKCSTYQGNQFIITNSKEGVEVGEGTGVYCTAEAYKAADGATTATMVARRLLDGVFTEEACCACSVTGLPPRGKGKDAYKDASAIKPGLDQKAVKAIVNLALKWQKIKKFLKKKDETGIRQAISVRLSELQKTEPGDNKAATGGNDGTGGQ